MENQNSNGVFTRLEILQKTDNGKNIIKYLISTIKISGTKSKPTKNPLYNDNNGSLIFYFKYGKWNFYDHGDPTYKGDVFEFAKKYYKVKYNLDLNFYQVLKKIYNDLKLDKVEANINIKESSDQDITFAEAVAKKEFVLNNRPFNEVDIKYFKQFGITQEILKEFGVTALVSYRTFDLENNKWKNYACYNPTYAYNGTGYAKIYCPNPKKFFYVGNKELNYVFGSFQFNNFGNGDIIIITAGEKDALTAYSLGYNAICFGSESVDPPKDFAATLFGHGYSPVVFYDNDTAGLTRGKEVAKLLDCRMVVIPNILKEAGGKDISDWVKLGLPLEILRNAIEGADIPPVNLINLKSVEPIMDTEVLNMPKADEENFQPCELKNILSIENMNSFPIDIFPIKIQNTITQTNKVLGYPVDFIGSSILYAASVALGVTHKIELKTGFVESGAIFLAIVANAGANKSHPLSFAIKPISDRDSSSHSNYLKAMAQFDEIDSMSKVEREEIGISLKEPHWIKSLVSDFTAEALADVHKYNLRGLGAYIDELAGWFKNFKRYNQGSEMEFWLTTWSGKSINIDRKTNPPIFIKMPNISVAGTIQTGLLHQIAKDDRSHNGFMDRILFAILEDLDKQYWNSDELNPEIEKDYEIIINKILDIDLILDEETKSPVPKILKLDPDAKELIIEWQKGNSDECNDTLNDSIKGIYNKMDIHCLRLSLILEALSFGCNENNLQSVSLKSVQGAIKLVEYFKKSALKVHALISKEDPLDLLSEEQLKVYNALNLTFKTSEGLKTAKEFNMPDRTFNRFLKNKNVFKWLRQGEYAKVA